MSYDIWCRHFTGLLDKECKVGVVYESVKDANAHPYRWPCFKDHGCAARCAPMPRSSPRKRWQRKSVRPVPCFREFLDSLANSICPHCKTAIAEKYQVVRLVAASMPALAAIGSIRANSSKKEGVQ